MSTNTNTKQTRQINTSDSSTDDESHCDHDHDHDHEHIEIDPTPERTPFGCVRCPNEGCERTVDTPRGLPSHYGQSHTGESLIIDLVGRETWIDYLRQEHVEREHRRPARDIARSIPDLITEDTVLADLKRFGIYERFAESNVTAYEILSDKNVTTIEEAQAMSRKLREEGGA